MTPAAQFCAAKKRLNYAAILKPPPLQLRANKALQSTPRTRVCGTHCAPAANVWQTNTVFRLTLFFTTQHYAKCWSSAQQQPVNCYLLPAWAKVNWNALETNF